MIKSLISTIVVRGLFGLYSYRLPQDGQLSDAAILYGDNGQGKSTILRLAFHLLSSAPDRGHRGHLFKADFESLELHLSSGVVLRAEKTSAARQPMKLSIEDGKQVLATWHYLPPSLRQREYVYEDLPLLIDSTETRTRLRGGARAERSGPPDGEVPYLSLLEQISPAAFILNAERRLDSDAVPDPSDEIELRRYMRIGEPKRIQDLVVRSREVALSQALAAADKRINQRVFEGAQRGTTNVHAVYSKILSQVASKRPKAQVVIDSQLLLDRLNAIEGRSRAYATYGLSTPLSISAFVAALTTRSTSKRAMAIDLMLPYLESLEKRFDALKPVFETVDKFVTIINGFLRDKQMTYSPGDGFRIVNRLDRQLEPSQLSSGEQQLLLLFCYVLIGRDTPSVFMIDEPEISLNVKWQRRLVNSLLELTDRNTTQFVFATHSIELLAQHRDRVVPLLPLEKP